MTPQMWEVYDKMCVTFESEKSLFFGDAMPCFYKFITINTDAFLSNAERPRKMLQMCNHVMNDVECGDDIRAGAVKILEILLLHCHGRLDHYIADITVLLMQHFAALPGDFGDFETQLAVTLIAAFAYNPAQFMANISVLEPYKEKNFQWMFEKIVKGCKHFNGMHDRIMTLYACFMALRLPAENRPTILVTHPQDTLKLFMDLFNDIKRCRISVAENNKSDSNDSDSDDDEDANDSKRKIEPDLNDSDDDLNEGKT
jgi:hypothetical protein